MNATEWTKGLRSLYDKGLALYQTGNRDAARFFDAEEKKFLSSIGLKPIDVFDFVEDWFGSGDPDWDTFLLIAAARRDYFFHQQDKLSNSARVKTDDLPPRKAELDGIDWLPRIIVKAQCFLEGSLDDDIMYCCGGDRHFLQSYGLHPADFLRVVWAAKGDEKMILGFVRSAGRSN